MNSLVAGTFMAVFVVAMSARAGVRASAGRTGLVNTSGHDRRGAWRGAAVGVGLLALVAAVTTGAMARDLVTRQELLSAAIAQATVYVPYALALSLALLAGRSRNWKFRSGANALGVGILDLVWPAVALFGVAFVVFTGSGGMATTVSTALVTVTLVTRHVVEILWHRTPTMRQ